jgi:hypothetical protein
MINAILLQAAAAMVEELKARLSQNFELRMVTDIFTEWEEVEAKHWPGGKVHVLSSWKIENVDARNKKVALEEIERFPEQYGCPMDVFVKAVNRCCRCQEAVGLSQRSPLYMPGKYPVARRTSWINSSSFRSTVRSIRGDAGTRPPNWSTYLPRATMTS